VQLRLIAPQQDLCFLDGNDWAAVRNLVFVLPFDNFRLFASRRSRR
jgi:hypothetical protein